MRFFVIAALLCALLRPVGINAQDGVPAAELRDDLRVLAQAIRTTPSGAV
ncbi:MAG: hypothetical protein JO036_08510 [Candidatus Eremiobacteraeota bacterium]|nr:hypothetical protein [Candidatus Eremiobacteraeota bacterium]